MRKHKHEDDEALDEYTEVDEEGSDIDELVEYVMADINDILLDTYDKIESKVHGLVDDIVKHHV